MLSVSLREPDVLRRLRENTADAPYVEWQIAPEHGQFLAFLVELIGARRVLEIGTFMGYSALAMALSMAKGSQLITCDLTGQFVPLGIPFWQEAGVHTIIELRIGAGLDVQDQLLADNQAETFDFVFIDADKQNYPSYYERALQLVRPGGLIAIDNVLWRGEVINRKNQKTTTETIRAFNQNLHTDERVSMCMLAVDDGLTLARKR
ncbi:MAG: class I SAM-dependent methyltransferase [Rhodospirillales bacterium]|nr:class I SAM-dependent methyltransferase [Rhodospirillales bacterium]